MKEYYEGYRKGSNYDLNKKDNETLEQFNKRKEQEYKQDIKPLGSKEAEKLFRLLK